MKARTPPSAKLSKKQIDLIEKMSHELAEEALKREQKNLMRRWFKLMCVALHNTYGFSTSRLAVVIQEIDKLSAAAEKDEIFWEHVDRVVIDELKMAFDKEEENLRPYRVKFNGAVLFLDYMREDMKR